MGTPGNPPNRIANGGPNNVSCSVKGSGSTFSITLVANSQSTTTGGSMTLTGSNISSDTGGTNLTGDFVGVITQGQYSSPNCTLTYSTPEGSGGIDPGRIWGHIECVGAINGSVMVGGGMVSTCTIDVDFVFENCSS
jgi:hypothetical protein